MAARTLDWTRVSKSKANHKEPLKKSFKKWLSIAVYHEESGGILNYIKHIELSRCAWTVSYEVKAVKYNHSETQFFSQILDRYRWEIDCIPILSLYLYFSLYACHIIIPYSKIECTGIK